ncbi:MAG: hydroxyethylthiazole kinase [Pseudomonadota bacterium]|jgi:hydroxyethylthiazole kinase
MKTKNNLSASSSAFTLASLFDDLALIRQSNPLIHNISNLVVMPITANVLLALGAAPIMAHAKQELNEIIQHAQSFVINIGTLDKTWVTSIKIGQKAALKRGIPIVLDPVGAGSSDYRTQTALKILAQGVQIIRANASEIMALIDAKISSKGVDSTQSSINALASAKILAKKYHCIVVISGKIDFVVSATRVVSLAYGTALLTKVVGMGCSLTAMIASFLTVNTDPFAAAVHATALMGLVAEYAEKKSTGPGSFYTQLLDSLYTIQKTDLQSLISGET